LGDRDPLDRKDPQDLTDPQDPEERRVQWGPGASWGRPAPLKLGAATSGGWV